LIQAITAGQRKKKILNLTNSKKKMYLTKII
jgi:hypothetical protein